MVSRHNGEPKGDEDKRLKKNKTEYFVTKP